MESYPDEQNQINELRARVDRLERRLNADQPQKPDQQIKDAFYAGYWSWFGPATKQELARGCSELDKSWLEYEATLAVSRPVLPSGESK